MSALSREMVFLILQFLDEEKFKETVHKLEQESGFFFNMKYLEDEVQNGNWDGVEKYLSGFTKVDDNRHSMKIFFEIRKQKYLEALDKHDHPMAVDILVNDLKVVASYNEDLSEEIAQLLTLENFRENQQFSKYGDAKSARATVLDELKKLFEANPLFCDKLQFPNLKNSRLQTLVNHSLEWQHLLCKDGRRVPDIKTLFTDHSCSLPNGVHAPSSFRSTPSKAGSFPFLLTHMPSPAPVPVPPADSMSNPPAFPVVPGNPIRLSTPAGPATTLDQVKTPQTSNLTIEHSSVDSDFASKRAWSVGITDKEMEMTEKLHERQGDEETKGMFLNIKNLLRVVLCKNKLERPRPPPPALPAAPPDVLPALTYRQRHHRGGEATSSQATSSHEEYIHDLSQPPSTIEHIASFIPSSEIEQEMTHVSPECPCPPSKGMPQELRRLRN